MGAKVSLRVQPVSNRCQKAMRKQEATASLAAAAEDRTRRHSHILKNKKKGTEGLSWQATRHLLAYLLTVVQRPHA